MSSVIDAEALLLLLLLLLLLPRATVVGKRGQVAIGPIGRADGGE